jgi:hypothetical protein
MVNRDFERYLKDHPERFEYDFDRVEGSRYSSEGERLIAESLKRKSEEAQKLIAAETEGDRKKLNE